MTKGKVVAGANGEIGLLLEVVVRAAPNGILVVDGEGRIALANRRAQELFGYEEEEILGLRAEDLMPERLRGKHEAFRGRYERAPAARGMGAGRDLYGRRKDGREFPVEIGLSPVEAGGEAMVVATVIDISERKKAEEAMRRQVEILNSVHDAVFLANAAGVIKSWNAGAEEVYGYEEEEVVGRNVRMLLSEDDPDRYVRVTYPCVLEKERCDFVCWGQRKGGRRIALAVRARLLRGTNGEPEGAVLCATDITRQKLLEQKVIEVSENEQRRIGQDIHDDLCQQLASIGCFTKVLEQRLKESYEEGAEHLAQIGEMISQANVRAREIARDLVPAIVESEGLRGALEELAKRTERVFGVECSLEGEEEVPILSQAAVQLYRIAQEAVGNAVRHGQPAKVSIALRREPDRLVLSIADNGKGMAKTTGVSGLGLLTMAHRTQMLDGDFHIDTGGGRGTRIECAIPYPYRTIEA